MRRLVNTQLFCLLKKMNGTFEPDEQEIALVYDEFVDTVTLICTSQKEGVPANFTIHYTRLELQRLQTLLNKERFEKKDNSKLHHS